MTQNERLDYLVEAFKADSGEYRNLRTPKDTEGKRRILRSLMNHSALAHEHPHARRDGRKRPGDTG